MLLPIQILDSVSLILKMISSMVILMINILEKD